MKQLFLYLCLILTITTTPLQVFASSENQVAVYDLANVLSEDEEEFLLNAGNDYIQLYDLDIVFLTASDTHGKSSMVYSDDFYDGIEGPVCYGENGLIAFVDLDNGYDYIGTIGTSIANINDLEVEQILDEAFTVAEEDYCGRLYTLMNIAIEKYSTDTAYDYTTGVSQSYQRTFSDYALTFLTTFAKDIPIAGIIIACLVFSHKKQQIVSASFYEKENKSTSGYVAQSANFVRSYQTISKDYYKPKSSGSSRSGGGGSSHRSSSGRSHGGGGRRR